MCFLDSIAADGFARALRHLAATWTLCDGSPGRIVVIRARPPDIVLHRRASKPVNDPVSMHLLNLGEIARQHHKDNNVYTPH